MTLAWILGAAAAWGFTSSPSAPQRDKSFGAVILETGSGADWKYALAAIKKEVGSEFPIEEAPATDPKAFQQAIDRLTGRRVKKIVILPLELSSYSVLMDQVRYLLGIRKEPSSDFLLGSRPESGVGGVSAAKIKRLAIRLPAVLAGAFDDEPLIADILTSRAQALSKNPSRESLLLVAEASSADRANSQWAGAIDGLAEKVRAKGNFAACRVFILPQDASQFQREKSVRELRETAKSLRPQGAALIVVPLTLDHGEVASKIRAMLDGIFFKYDGKAVLPDPRVAGWVKLSVSKAAALPDMRSFKDDGRAIPKPLAHKMTLKSAPGATP